MQNVRLEHEGAAGTEADSGEAQGEEATAESQHQNSPGNLGGEAPRQGPRSPVGEQVEDRAYPKSYVSDRVALQGAKDFKSLPSAAPANSFKSAADFRAASRGGSQQWKALGPVTPDVAAEATQFFDTQTGTGTPTTNSGRVTAMAIDPNCGKHARRLPRLWVAAAGGGIWRTPDALAAARRVDGATRRSCPPTRSARCIVDPNDRSGDTLYAGSGEPNGSGDSEAGLGLFKSTDGGTDLEARPRLALRRDQPLDRGDRGQAGSPEHDLHRHRRRSPRLLVGQRRPAHAARTRPPSASTSRPTAARHFTLVDRPPAQDPGQPDARLDRRRLVPGRDHQARVRPEQRPHGSTPGCSATASGARTTAGTTWRQIFHTVNQTDFSNPATRVTPSATAPSSTLFNTGAARRGVYLGDSSDDLGVAEVWRTNDADTNRRPPTCSGTATTPAGRSSRSTQNGTNGFLAYDYCQNGQCGYDDFVESPPGRPPARALARRLDELRRAARLRRAAAALERPRGDSLDQRVGAGVAGHVAGHDRRTPGPPGDTEGMHPDQHAIVFDPNEPGDRLRRLRRWRDPGRRSSTRPTTPRSAPSGATTTAPARSRSSPPTSRTASACWTASRAALDSLNNGLNTIQFQSLSVNPSDPKRQLLGGTQDNGTFFYTGNADLDRDRRRRRRPVRLRPGRRDASATTPTTTRRRR